MIGITIGYPDELSEIKMLKQESMAEKINSLNEALNIQDVIEIRTQVKHVYVSEQIYEYIVAIVNGTRSNQLLDMGISPRGSIDILNMAKANAFIEGRDYVIPSDVQTILVDTASHRIRMSRYAKLENRRADQILLSILDRIPIPKGIERKR
jgi:MoxR-like ATPase